MMRLSIEASNTGAHGSNYPDYPYYCGLGLFTPTNKNFDPQNPYKRITEGTIENGGAAVIDYVKVINGPKPEYSRTASIKANDAGAIINDSVSYTVYLDNPKGVGICELKFLVDDKFFDIPSIVTTPLNGFGRGAFDDLSFEYKGSGIWEGTVKYMYIPFGGGYVGVDNPLAVFTISGTAISTGQATITLSDYKASGDTGKGIGNFLALIRIPEASIPIASKPAVYSKYDLNKDGSIDGTDLLYLVYFYQRNDREPSWDTEDLYGVFAKDCDFQVNGRIDLADMIELIANYGVYDPFSW
jgi:hypothetical protein